MIFGQIIGQKVSKYTNYSIYGHTFFGHNSAIFWPIGLKCFVGTKETIIYWLLVSNQCYADQFLISICLAGKRAWLPRQGLRVRGFRTREKFEPRKSPIGSPVISESCSKSLWAWTPLILPSIAVTITSSWDNLYICHYYPWPGSVARTP